MKQKSLLFVAILLFVLSLVLRTYSVIVDSPFWVDEFSTAFQANLIRTYGFETYSQTDYYVEYHNVIPHLLVAASFTLFGESTTSARLPFLIIGSLVPVLVWLVGNKVLKNKGVSLAAALLTACSYFQITWSLQARGYVLQQSILLLLILSYFSLVTQKNKTQQLLSAVAIVVLVVLGILTHLSFMLVLLAFTLHAVWNYRGEIRTLLQRRKILVLPLLLTIVFVLIRAYAPIHSYIQQYLIGNIPNNLPYYHAFLWREYGLLTALSILGLVYGLIKERKVFALFGLLIAFYLVAFSFIFEPKVSRYLLPIFPLLFLSAAYGLGEISQSILRLLPSKKMNFLGMVLPSLFAFFIIINGHKFVVKPKLFYSVNHDFREIALVDYDRVYGLIKNDGKLELGQTAVIDTWGDRLAWYLSADYEPSYIFRWTNDQSELLKNTAYEFNDQGEKIVQKRKGMRLISTAEDLQTVIQKYPRGFIWIDDSSLPADVLQYAEEHLHKELFLDHYMYDDNPYSLWPGTLYSWGVR